MRKCKQVVSMLLVLCMMFAVISVGIVQGAAADGDGIYADPPSEPALLGDVNRDGRINGDDVLVLRKSITHNFTAGYLDYTKMSRNSIDFKVADCFKDEEYGIEEKIDANDVLLLRQYIVHKPVAMDKGIGEPVYVDPTEPPTQAPTDASTTATITIYGLNGQSETKEFNVGDSFVVLTSLNVKKSGNDVQIAAASGDQNFTDSVLTLTSTIDSEQLFTDSDTVFPVFGNKAMGRLRGEGWVQYNASTPGVNNGFVFDSDDDLMIVTEYTVTKGGTGEVRNALSYLAAADIDLTGLVKEGAVASDVDLTVNATFEKPMPPATEAPTQAPKPTVAPTQAPKPTTAPTQAPKPTTAPTQAPKPTTAPTQAPKPTTAPTQAPKPTTAPTQAQDKAFVTVSGLDGRSETKEFNVGDDFYVYTTLNASQINSGKIGSINGCQLYPNAMIKLIDEYNEEGIIDLEDMFPITKSNTMASGHHTSLEDLEGPVGEKFNHDPTRGTVAYTASIASSRGFRFDSNDDILIKTHYQVTALGEAAITNEMRTLSASDDSLTQLIEEWEIVNPNFRLHASFLPPDQQPTDGPMPTVAPTQAPKPTQAPTQAPKPTTAPTQAPKPTQAPTEPTPEDTYIVAGNDTAIFGTSWNGNDTNNTMTFANNVWSKEYTVDSAKKEVQLKAVKNGTEWIGDETGNNVTFNLTGAGTFTVYCDGTKAWVDGDIVTYDEGLAVESVTAVGNGSLDGDNWLNNISWDPAAEANHMTKVADGVYEIEYTLGEYDTSDPEFKFAVNDAWTHNFGLGDNGVIANGVTTDAIYNGPKNLKIEGLTEGTVIKMQLDLTGFDFTTKTGAKMTVTWTAPTPTQAPTQAPKPTVAPTQAPKPTVAPTQAPKPTTAPTQAPKPTTAPTQAPKPTTAPTQAPKPTTAPTQAPTQPQGKANVTVYGLDGRPETKEFNVGDDFYVYTTLNASQINSGKIGSINGFQLYPNAMIKLLNEYDNDGFIDLEEMFPITGNNTVASGNHTTLEDVDVEQFHQDPTRGAVGYTASVGSKRGFPFDSNDDILIKVHYQVTAPGDAVITNEMRTLSASDDDLTKLIEEFEIINSNFRLHASFLPPDQQPTDGPTEAPKPTVAPTQAPKPTQAPTEAPKPTVAPTEPAPEDTYIVAGNDTAIFGTSWNGNDTGNTMTKGSDGIYTKQYTIGTAMKDVQLKAVKNGTEWIGDETGNNVTFNLKSAGTFTVYCDGAKTWVDGDIVTYDEGLDVQSVTAVGNGSLDGDNWLNNISWDPAAEANHMTKVADGVYEIEYTLGEYDTSDPEFKFAVNDAWTHNFGLGDNGVIANGVTTDAIYNGPKNLKIEGLEPGTTIKMQLDLTGFDFTTKTGAKMTVTWTAPTPTQAPTQAPKPTVAPTQAPKPTVAPTQAPKPTTAPTQAPKPTTAPTQAPKPTTAPTQAPKPTTAPTQAPTQPQGKANVTVYGLDGRPETKEFNVGDDFYVYTTLNASQINSGKIGSINGFQLYPNAMIKLLNEYDNDGFIDLEEMFPITGNNTVASGNHTTLEDVDVEQFHQDPTRGAVGYTASVGSKRGFPFDSNDDILIKVHYQVTAPGDAVITNEMRTLSASDDDLTKLIEEFEIINSNFRLHASFLPPDQQPTDGPTEAPKPTVAPTQAPKPTTAPTQAPTQAPTTPPVTLNDGYYLVGTMTDWKADAAYMFSQNTANPGEYMLSTALSANDGIKAVKVENGEITTWYPDGMDNEYVVDAAHAGDVDIYFKTTYQSDWSTFGGYLYIDTGSTPTPDPTTAPTETSDDTDRTIIFSNNKGFSTVNIYYWSDEDQPVDWPGVPMTYYDTNEVGEKRYSFEMPEGMTYYIINDGTQQTVDITFSGATGVYLTNKDNSECYEVAFYDIGKTDPTPEPTTAPQPTQAPEPDKNYVYLAPNIWDVADATERFQLYVWNDDGDRWITGTAVNGKYQFEVPTGFTDGIFVRMDSAKAADDWSSVWNQTGDLTLQIGKTYTIASWAGGDNGNSGGSWS